MDKKTFIINAKELIATHQPDYSLELSKTKTIMGQCNYQKRLIRVSDYYVQALDWDSLKNIVLHEIAHAKTGPGHGHDRVWRNACVSLGVKPQRTSNVPIVNDFEETVMRPKYKKVCPKCSYTKYCYRKPKRIGACRICCEKYNHGRFSKDFVFNIEVLK